MSQTTPNQESKPVNQRARIAVTTLLVITVLVIAAWQWQKVENAKANPPEYTTTPVSRGDLVLTVTGTGNLEAGTLTDVAFSTAGTVAEVNVKAGDEVKQGQILAVLDGLEELQLEVETQTLAVASAEKELASLQSSGDRLLAEAQIELSSAEAAYEEARDNLHQKGDGRCAKSLTEDYYYTYLAAKLAADEWRNIYEDGSGYGTDYVLEHLNPLLENENQAYLNWKYCEGYSEQEILESEAALSTAEAAYHLAKSNYAEQANNAGIPIESLELAQMELDNAQKSLAAAQHKLAGATLIAPKDGVITSVAAIEGETVGTDVFIEIADLYHPVVKIQIDEVDLQNISNGCSAEVQFDAIPDRVFKGEVSQISPALVTVFDFDTISGLINLEDQSTASGKILPIGLNALVDLHCKRADDVLYVPLEAVNYAEDGGAFVYVLDNQGEAQKRAITTGLETITSIEITSGLNEGEQVITSKIADQTSQS